ncbi:MAG: hypothetical protein JNL01_04315 [Bdellovibrionales bacterium]|nr:hypothetical protein [Bdellovibrionales bacterium]
MNRILGAFVISAFAATAANATTIKAKPATDQIETSQASAEKIETNLPAAAAIEQKVEKDAQAASAPAATTSEASIKQSGLKKFLGGFGANYFTFIDGPGFGQPAHLPVSSSTGYASDSGISMWTNLSVRYKLTDRIGLDYQFRLQQIFDSTRPTEPGFITFRDQGGRIGISGTLLKGADWSLSGAFNTDVPGIGQIPQARTQIINPGLFSSFNYRKAGSKWSVFALVSPRVFIYRDADALAPQDVTGTKPQILFVANPSINYALSENQGLRAGMTLDIRKNSGQSFQRWFAPVEMGYTYKISKHFTLYPHIRFSTPLDDGLRERVANDQTIAKRKKTPNAAAFPVMPWTHTASVGLWINGVIF